MAERAKYFHFHNKPHDYPALESLRIAEKAHRNLSLSEFRRWWFGSRGCEQKFFIGDIVRIMHFDELPKADKFSSIGGAFEYGPPAPVYGIVVAVNSAGNGVAYSVGEAADDPNAPRKIIETVEERRLLLVDRTEPSKTGGGW